jgi:hypothetical protein
VFVVMFCDYAYGFEFFGFIEHRGKVYLRSLGSLLWVVYFGSLL